MTQQGQSRSSDSVANDFRGSGNNATRSGSQNTSSSPGAQARQKTGEVIDEVEEKAGDMVDQLREQATSQVTAQKQRLAEGLTSVAQMVRMGEDQLRHNNQGMVADYTGKLADKMENVSTFVRERDLNDMVHEVEGFARREPVLFLGGAFTLGLLASRFLKSSPSSQTSSSQQSTSALARRAGSGNDSSTHTPLTPPPVSQPRTTDYDDDAARLSESSVARHFGANKAAGAATARPSQSSTGQGAGRSQAGSI